MNTLEKIIRLEESGHEADIVLQRNISRLPIYGEDMTTEKLVVVICTSGQAKLLYDMNEMMFTAGEVAVVMPNHILHPIESSQDYKATRIILSAEFFKELKLRMLSHNYSKYHIVPSRIFSEKEIASISKMIDVIEIVLEKPTEQLPHRREMLIQLIIITYELISQSIPERENTIAAQVANNNSIDKRSNILFNEFCDLLAHHYREQHEASFYAQQLHLSTKYFSKLIHDAVGVTAKAWIEQYILVQAKQLLSTRHDMQIQQVAYYLGFTDQATFCRFFARTSGMTARDFRRSIINEK